MVDIKSLSGLTQDSRQVSAGYLFAAFPGQHYDGREYIEDAIQKGAKVILAPEGTSFPSVEGVEFIAEEKPRKVFARMVAEFYGRQPENIVAVTGTNGKTSVVHFTKQIWEALGFKAASIGTLSGAMTTSDPVTLHTNLKKFADEGITHLAMEASSHGLDQYRLDGVEISAAGFTNLSRDHLDYHKTMEGYLGAKARLFNEIIGPEDVAVINADVKECETLVPQIKANVWTYGKAGKTLKLEAIEPTPEGQSLTLDINNDTYRILLPLVGDFQAMNAICALGLVLAEDGVDQEKAVLALESLSGAPGRLQSVSGHPEGAGVYVDYAHTPDALSNVLNALRPHTHGKLICLFGCGGDRDTGKRPEMGAIATKLADEVIVTDDNPRSEDPASIRSSILAAAPNALEIGDRRDAITQTVRNLSQGDVLLIAGKGHEQGQIFADHTDPFDDVTEVEIAIKSL